MQSHISGATHFPPFRQAGLQIAVRIQNYVIAIQVLVCVIVPYSQYYKQVRVCLWPVSQLGPVYPFLQRHVLGAAHSMFLPQACLHTAEGTNGMQTQITHGQIQSINTQTHICLHLRPEAQEARVYTDSLCTAYFKCAFHFKLKWVVVKVKVTQVLYF